MNKNVFFVLAFTCTLLGCMAQTAPSTSGTLICSSIPAESCAGDKNDPKNTIYLDTMTVDFECIKAKKGRAIIFSLESASEISKGSVEIFAKDSKNDWWLAGTNSPNKKKILVLAPKKKESGKTFADGKYEYGIRTSAKCVDPRIHVTN